MRASGYQVREQRGEERGKRGGQEMPQPGDCCACCDDEAQLFSRVTVTAATGTTTAVAAAIATVAAAAVVSTTARHRRWRNTPVKAGLCPNLWVCWVLAT